MMRFPNLKAENELTWVWILLKSLNQSITENIGNPSYIILAKIAVLFEKAITFYLPNPSVTSRWHKVSS